jgi:hypothetical protein
MTLCRWIRRMLCWLGTHDEVYRWQDDVGRRWFVCQTCGYKERQLQPPVWKQP